MALAGVIGNLQQTSMAPAVRRAADDLAAGFIAPVADGATDDLRQRQQAVVNNVSAAVEAQSKALAAAADKIIAKPPVKPERFTPLSAPDAVLRYAGDFLPSWAGAISIVGDAAMVGVSTRNPHTTIVNPRHRRLDNPDQRHGNGADAGTLRHAATQSTRGMHVPSL